MKLKAGKSLFKLFFYTLKKRIGVPLQRYLEIQLFITNASLPILISWGLPLSLMSPIGNALFSPILTIWLFCASIIFVTELIYLPNNTIIYILEHVTLLYEYLLSCAPSWAILAIGLPPFWLIPFPLIISLYILYASWFNSSQRRIAGYLVTFFIFYLGCTAYHSLFPLFNQSVECSPGKVHIFAYPKETWIIDPGYLNKNWADASWLNYQLLPSIIKQTHSCTIEGIVILHATYNTLKNLHMHIIGNLKVHRIVCCISPEIIKQHKFEIYKLARHCKHHAIKLNLIKYPNQYTILNEKQQQLILTPHTLAKPSLKQHFYWSARVMCHEKNIVICDRQTQTKFDKQKTSS